MSENQTEDQTPESQDEDAQQEETREEPYTTTRHNLQAATPEGLGATQANVNRPTVKSEYLSESQASNDDVAGETSEEQPDEEESRSGNE